jgi:RimJ/RimL family protein N-acetyltransferase
VIDAGAYRGVEPLKGGGAATVRALRPDDRERVAHAVRNLERETIYYRMFAHRGELTEAGLDRIMRFDPQREVALLVTVPERGGETVAGSGRYVAGGPASAEVAFVDEENYQGRGIASALLRHLATIACANGITTFEADVLADNKAMQTVFARCGWPVQTRRDGHAVHFTLALTDRKA